MQSLSLGIMLTGPEVQAIMEAHPPEGELFNYGTFSPVAHNYVLQLHGNREPGPQYWVRLNGHNGAFWLHKVTGAVQRDVRGSPLHDVSDV